MEISESLLCRIESDLGLNIPFIKGAEIPVRNCWHCYTDGKSVDVLFNGQEDFEDGMNRVFILSKKHRIVILAFVLMDTHVHFVLYGTLEDCVLFMREYIRRTSQYLEHKYHYRQHLETLKVTYQQVKDLRYLKTVICYVIKNPPLAGLPYLSYTYPWSSGSLYFSMLESSAVTWNAPRWKLSSESPTRLGDYSQACRYALLKSREELPLDVKIIDGMVFPGEYVAYNIVERIFKTCKSFNYFLCHSKEDEVESKEESSVLSLPIQEMRQHKSELCLSMFGTDSVRKLTTAQRLSLAKALKHRYYSSTRQLARLCGLVYEEIKDMV